MWNGRGDACYTNEFWRGVIQIWSLSIPEGQTTIRPVSLLLDLLIQSLG